MQVCVINLDRSPERMAAFSQVNAHLGEVVRYSAVDGRALDLAALVAARLVAPDIHKTYTQGAVGCAMSHIALWKQAIASGQTLTIAEDDAIFHGQFRRYAAGVIENLPPDWDIILWGWNFDLFLSLDLLPGVTTCLAQFEQAKSRSGIRVFQERELRPQPIKLRWAFGTPCYSITAKGARRIVDKCLPLKPLVIPFLEGLRAEPRLPYFRAVGIDVTMSSIYRELNAFACFPPLVITRNDIGSSTIAPTR